MDVGATGSAFSYGVTGVQKGMAQVTEASAKVAGVAAAENPTKELTEGAVDLISGKQQVEASSKVLRTANETLGSIIDIEV